jgi:hypothetical protein
VAGLKEGTMNLLLRHSGMTFTICLVATLVPLIVSFCIAPESKRPPAPDQPIENRKTTR